MIVLLAVLLLIFSNDVLAENSVFLDRYVWRSEDERFGGMSGVSLSDDGMEITAISDRGYITRAAITRDADGRISEISPSAVIRIRNAPGDRNYSAKRDSEGLAISPDGTIYISFEHRHRVARFASLDAPEDTLPPHPDFEGMQSNSSLEALAIDGGGALYTIPERSGRFDVPFPIYRYSEGTWDIPYALPRVGSFLVVGADFGPDGLLYVLERDFTGFSFLNRVRRIDLEQGQSTTVVLNGGQYGNLEGISVWRDANGQLTVSMIADNNYQALLQTEIVEYQIDG